MKCYEIIDSEVREGIPIHPDPYHRVVLGQGGNKRATWIPLGRRDKSRILTEDEDGALLINDAGVYVTRTEKRLIVAPSPGNDDRVMVLWRVASGYRGTASIDGSGATVVAQDQAWHSGRGSLGSTAECLAILKPGQTLEAKISGRRVQMNRARLTWDGDSIDVLFYDSSAPPDADGEDGTYL